MRDHQSFPAASSNNLVSFRLRADHQSAEMRQRLVTVALVWSLLGLAAVPAPAACTAGFRQADALLLRTPCAGRTAVVAAQEKSADDKDDKPDDKPKTEISVRPESNSVRSRFGLAFRTSTLGLGADAGFRIARPVNLRVGFNTFHYARNLSSDGVPYQGSLHLRSLQAVVDWFPFSHSFHVGPGLLFFNNNRVTAVATPPVGKVLTAGAEAYVSDPQNPITGSAKSAMKKFAPMVLVGFGNLVPRKRHFGYSVDFGVVFQGVPKSTFTLAGGACDPTGEFCARAAEDSRIQAEAQSAQSDLDRHVRFMKYYPVVSAEFGYRF